MTPLHDHLSADREPLPGWLRDHRAGAPVELDAVLSGRVVYYPGAGSDGHAVQAFGSAHAAHAFVHADDGIGRESLLSALAGTHRGGRSWAPFPGYRVMDRTEPRGTPPPPPSRRAREPVDPYALLAVLERDPQRGEEHGPERLAVLFLAWDGHAAWGALWGRRRGRPAPHATLLQDHGFSGNRSPFGEGGELERRVERSGAWPRLLLVAENTRPWVGYRRVPGVEPQEGGMYLHPRWLHHRGEGT